MRESHYFLLKNNRFKEERSMHFNTIRKPTPVISLYLLTQPGEHDKKITFAIARVSLNLFV